MATSLAVPIAYITVLVTSLAIFSRVYRRRRAAEKTSFEPWFPAHPARDIYITLLGAEPPVPESMLKSALLVRATADVKRIWRIKEDQAALQGLHQRGLVGDDTMARFAAAEKELEAEIVDVVSEANTFRQGWGSIIFATASEMANAERTRDTVINIGKAKAEQEKRLQLRAKLLGLPIHQADLSDPATAIKTGSPSPTQTPTPTPTPAAVVAGPTKRKGKKK
ncbi:hypothetical protein CcaverHIS002_0603040 [Cutaneotrichosporon cavernicola]|uniref:Translocation protein sec66 n=1 Tax=Cutaneotrichosporon cavernicola TaxID=279322 RepID=A0AA48L897_9TREE|nr:uncharacterized protein CcaverHIS019_0602510 [Cutaneotrichosporon cavernicola]BEI86017.1 hypothetical protein CcaverHIS002_0603040 [Cutaneotrichosporon cavernicola]BEI93792.1 hypothetical protein CcaverHIS019_0602510 [Cutaneotrichosporon cavernicola]BEJ01569.1 hypothetical protein CcaverHIS631_0602510 [Cutaneotrichosporon cavernicola]BEJ09335.1 hypothetical protein CcaverHIS641_0602500 [Cutaneotrichosporon cavernicola]